MTWTVGRLTEQRSGALGLAKERKEWAKAVEKSNVKT
jgi:hypothetical protein